MGVVAVGREKIMERQPSYNPANFAPNNTIRYEVNGHTVCFGDCGGGTHRGGGGPTLVTFYLCDNIIVTSADVSCGHSTILKSQSGCYLAGHSSRRAPISCYIKSLAHGFAGG